MARINRLQLISLLNQRIAGLEQQQVADYEEAVQKEHDREEAYVKRTREAWTEYAACILQRVQADEAVRDDDKPGVLAREGSYRAQKPPLRVTGAGELKRLVGLLMASPDETVSLASLERAGFVLGRVLK